MSPGLRKLGTITTRFRRARQKANARIAEAITLPRRSGTKPTRFSKKKRATRPIAPKVIRYVTKATSGYVRRRGVRHRHYHAAP